MRPLTLSFEHFGPYRQRQDIDFSALDDFFLIYGKTGSGKTTIFDAIAYAMYGEAVGGRSNLERELVSRFSPAGSKPWIEFEFFASSARWKVRRSLPYRRQNRRGKESEAAGEVSLYRMNEAGAYELLADRPTTANQTLLELLRLSADEFSKIVLLPQGEFQQFLEMKTTERVEILEKLFDVRIYDEVTEIARRKVVQLDALLRAKREELERISNEVGAEPSARMADLERSLGELDVRIATMAQDASLLETEIAQKNERLAFWQALLAAWRAFSEIEQSKPAFDERERRLGAAKTLSALGSLAGQVDGQRDEVVAALDKALRTETELTRLESGRGDIEAAQKKLPSLREEQDELQRRAALYQRALEAWRQKAELLDQRQEALQRLHDAVEQCVRQEQAVAALKDGITELDRFVAGEPGAQEESQKNLMAGEALKRLGALFEQKERLEAQHSEILRKIQSTEDSILSIDRDLATAEENLARMDEEFRHAQAGFLAASLVAGEPCPVCGSREHPRPAGLPESAPTEESVRKAREAVERIKSLRSALLQNKENLESRLQEYEQELKIATRKISEEWREYAGEALGEVSRSAIESADASLKSQQRELEQRLKDYRDARETLQQMRRSLDGAERDYARIQKEKGCARHCMRGIGGPHRLSCRTGGERRSPASAPRGPSASFHSAERDFADSGSRAGVAGGLRQGEHGDGDTSGDGRVEGYDPCCRSRAIPRRGREGGRGQPLSCPEIFRRGGSSARTSSAIPTRTPACHRSIHSRCLVCPRPRSAADREVRGWRPTGSPPLPGRSTQCFPPMRSAKLGFSSCLRIS